MNGGSAQDDYPWTRRPGESPQAYDAFKIYLYQGTERSIRKVAKEIGKSASIVHRWSGSYGWVVRTSAYDSYLVSAHVDGEATELTRVRSKHLELADKLLDHLGQSMILWKPGQDPSIRWTNAFVAAAKVQQTALTLKETTDKSDGEALERIMSALEKRVEG